MDYGDIKDAIWQAVGTVVILCIVTVATFWIFAPKHVDGYYLSRGSNANAGMICVYAHWTWHHDEQAFCTDRYADALEFASKANAAIR